MFKKRYLKSGFKDKLPDGAYSNCFLPPTQHGRCQPAGTINWIRHLKRSISCVEMATWPGVNFKIKLGEGIWEAQTPTREQRKTPNDL